VCRHWCSVTRVEPVPLPRGAGALADALVGERPVRCAAEHEALAREIRRVEDVAQRAEESVLSLADRCQDGKDARRHEPHRGVMSSSHSSSAPRFQASRLRRYRSTFFGDLARQYPTVA
jgi:hypothetical protein